MEKREKELSQAGLLGSPEHSDTNYRSDMEIGRNLQGCVMPPSSGQEYITHLPFSQWRELQEPRFLNLCFHCH